MFMPACTCGHHSYLCQQIICWVFIYERRWIMRQRITKIGNIGELLNAMSNNCINIHYKSCYFLDASLIAFFLRTVKFLLLWKNFPFGTAKIRNILTTTKFFFTIGNFHRLAQALCSKFSVYVSPYHLSNIPQMSGWLWILFL